MHILGSHISVWIKNNISRLGSTKIFIKKLSNRKPEKSIDHSRYPKYAEQSNAYTQSSRRIFSSTIKKRVLDVQKISIEIIKYTKNNRVKLKTDGFSKQKYHIIHMSFTLIIILYKLIVKLKLSYIKKVRLSKELFILLFLMNFAYSNRNCIQYKVIIPKYEIRKMSVLSELNSES